MDLDDQTQTTRMSGNARSSDIKPWRIFQEAEAQHVCSKGCSEICTLGTASSNQHHQNKYILTSNTFNAQSGRCLTEN